MSCCLFMSWLLALVLVSQTADAQICLSSSTVNFSFGLFLNVEAIPGVTTQAEIDEIEALFLSSYNTVSICDQDGAVFIITNVRIVVDPVEFVTSGRRRLDSFQTVKTDQEEDPENSKGHRRLQLDVQSESPSGAPSMFESNIASSSSPSETPVFFSFQSVTWLVLVEGECNGCSTETSLFNDVSGRVLQHFEKHLKQSKGDRIHVKSSAVKWDETPAGPRTLESKNSRSLRVYKGSSSGYNDNICDCEPPFELPFIEEFNEQLQMVESVSGAENVVVLEQVQCSSEISNFRSTVVILADVDLDNFFDSVADLEVALLDGYNDINFLSDNTCDDFFRIVTNVTIDVQETLNSNSITMGSGVQSLLLVVVYSGQCRGCEGTPALTDNGSGSVRRKILVAADDGRLDNNDIFFSGKRHLSDTDAAECFCPVGINFSLPSTEVFVDSVNTTLDTVDSVQASGIFETTSVNCSANQNDFQAQVTIGLVVTGELDQTEIDAIEMSFEETYNSLIARYCDPFFRVVVNVTIVDVEFTSTGAGRMLQLDNVNATNTTTNSTTIVGNSTSSNSTEAPGNHTEAPGGTDEFFFAVFQIVVTGLCRGCDSGTSLFDDVSGRRNLFEMNNADGFFRTPDFSNVFRSLQTNDTTSCTCILNFVDTRAPSTAEFLEVFEFAVQEASPTVVIEESVIVFEGEASNSPSAEPSGTPTSPSAAPSESPSFSPSRSPSISPSAAPSVSPIPSSLPSPLPSSSPSDTPSVSPSSSPSTRPSTSPSVSPSDFPSLHPSQGPSKLASSLPSSNPSDAPSTSPSISPSDAPSVSPSESPSESPSNMPSSQPSFFTNDVCQGRVSIADNSVTTGSITEEDTWDPEINSKCLAAFGDPLPKGVWYSFTTGNNDVVVTTCPLSSGTTDGGGFSLPETASYPAVFYGDDGCPDDMGCYGYGVGEACGFLVFSGREGVRYYVVVFGDVGSFDLTVSTCDSAYCGGSGIFGCYDGVCCFDGVCCQGDTFLCVLVGDCAGPPCGLTGCSEGGCDGGGGGDGCVDGICGGLGGGDGGL